MIVHGPGSPYTLLFDDDEGVGPGLPEGFRAIYGGDWKLPSPQSGRPYIYTNFVSSHDGRITFDEPGHAGGGDISLHAPHDTWLMGLLRARADAVLTGAGTLRVALRHQWTPAAIFPADAQAFAELRKSEARAEQPLLVVLSASGKLPPQAAALAVPDQQVLIATTAEGAATARVALGERPQIRYFVFKGGTPQMPQLLHELYSYYAVKTVLSEAGAQTYGQLIAQHAIDETFLTLSPVVVGNRQAPAAPRSSLVEGHAFAPLNPPLVRPLNLRRAGDMLFLRSRHA
ncbi:deaminase [Candidatus Gracilibacteria bacterium]|nr:deaminase [Candidatus Gracilibacteria bacterium]